MTRQNNSDAVDQSCLDLASLANVDVINIEADTIVAPSGHCQEVCVVVRGVTKFLYTGSEGVPALLTVRVGGTIIGADMVFEGSCQEFLVLALTQCAVARISLKQFIRCMEIPAFCLAASRVLAQDVNNALRFLRVRYSGATARGRLELLLHHLQADDVGEPRPLLRTPLLHKDLAQLIGVSPEHLSRIITAMEADGVIRRERGWLVWH